MNCGSRALPCPTERNECKPISVAFSLPKTVTLKPYFFPVSVAQSAKYFGVTLLGGKSTKLNVSSCACAILIPFEIISSRFSLAIY